MQTHVVLLGTSAGEHRVVWFGGGSKRRVEACNLVYRSSWRPLTIGLPEQLEWCESGAYGK